MDWEVILMDPIVQGAIITVAGSLALATLGGFIKIVQGVIDDKNVHLEIKNKMGTVKTSSLEEQHDDIEKSINIRTNDIEKSINTKTDYIQKAITEKTSSIYTKVDNIDKITIKNEALYQNLNQDQKEVRDNVNKLIYDWERVISENKELNSELRKVREDNQNMKDKLLEFNFENKNITQENNSLKRENTILKHDNKSLKDEIESLKNQNNRFVNQNKELQTTNEKLSKNLSMAKQALDKRNIQYNQVEDLDENREDDWDMEI